jgi:protein-tyrosine phosphatase
LKGRAEQHAFTWHVAERDDLQRLVADVPLAAKRLLDRYWPGPLTIVLPTRAGGTAGVRLPAHDFTRAVIAACGEPLWLTSVNRTGEPPLLDADLIAGRYTNELSIVVDDGRSPLGTASTVVRKTGPRLEVLREGILSASEVLHTAADLVLFVCTGNTCRSPLAEALARDLTARTLGVPTGEVLSRGVAFASAGISTMPGMPASEGSLAAAEEVEVDLSGHQTRVLDVDTVQRADHVFCMTASHRQAILAEVPQAAPRVALLRPDGLDITDPYGRDLAAYRRVRDEIRAAIGARMKAWLPSG